MAPTPYGLLDRIAAGDTPADNTERRQWIAMLLRMRAIPYRVIAVLKAGLA